MLMLRTQILENMGTVAGVFAFVLCMTACAGSDANKTSHFLSVLDFGAIPNDGHDDVVAIQSCLDEATRTGKACFIPKGHYELNGDLWLGSNAILYGEGHESVLTFSKGMMRALKNGSRNFYYTKNYCNIITPGKYSKAFLAEPVAKGSKTLVLTGDTTFQKGDWVLLWDYRKDTWKILCGKATKASWNGCNENLTKGQLAQIADVTNSVVTLDRKLDADYPAESLLSEHVGARNIHVHDLTIIGSTSSLHTVLFEAPFNTVFERVSVKGGAGIWFLNGAFRCAIRNCRIDATKSRAVTLSAFCCDNNVSSNTISYVTGGDCAVLVMMQSHNNLITENTIECYGKKSKNEGGVFIHVTSSNNRITNNRIHGASEAIGTFYGANRNIFKDNSGSRADGAICAWYAGPGNVFENNRFSFDSKRPGRAIAVYTYYSQDFTIRNNVFSGGIDCGLYAGPQDNISLKRVKDGEYLLTLTGLGFDGNVQLKNNTFKSDRAEFVEIDLSDK